MDISSVSFFLVILAVNGLAVWLVAVPKVFGIEALSCQVTHKFIKCRNVKSRTISAIEATRC